MSRDELGRAFIAALDDEDLQAIADLVRARLRDLKSPERRDGWMGSDDAADYLGLTTNALYKLTATRRIPFEQDGPGCRLWFFASELDAWRRAR